jgi:hypothetical protein
MVLIEILSLISGCKGEPALLVAIRSHDERPVRPLLSVLVVAAELELLASRSR